MSALTKSGLLFLFNLLDAQLTILWVRNGLATEGNELMAWLLEIGDAPFLLTKVFIGAAAACTLYRWSHLRLAQKGLGLSLGLYSALMLVHVATGLSALNWYAPEIVAAFFHELPNTLLVDIF